MKKIAAFVTAAAIIGSTAFYFLNKPQEIIYLGSFSGREGHLGNSFFRGLSFYANEKNQKRHVGSFAVVALDYEGKAENIAKAFETEKERVAKLPVIVQGSETLLKSFIDAKSLVLPAHGRIAIASDVIGAQTVPACITESSATAVIADAVSFARKNLGSSDPVVISADAYKDLVTLKDLKHASVETVAASSSTKDSVVIIVVPAEQVLATANALRVKGYKGRVVVPAHLSYLDMRAQLANVPGESYLIANYSSGAFEPALKKIIDSYAKQFNEPPSQYSFFGYACAARLFQDKELDVNSLLSVKAFKIEKDGDVTIAITR